LRLKPELKVVHHEGDALVRKRELMSISVGLAVDVGEGLQ
jgi:hypothetical protein